VEQGIISLTRCSAGGERRVLAICAAGMTLGLSSAMTSAAHAASAHAVTDSVIRGFDARDMVRQCGQEPSFGSWISVMLARETMNHLTFTASLALGARQRLMRLFAIVMASDCSTRTDEGSLRVPTGLTHRDIAEAIWTTRETVTRLLVRLASEGVAQFDRGELIVSPASPLHVLVAGRNSSRSIVAFP
jgi:CRP-like cAMP-binding protein